MSSAHDVARELRELLPSAGRVKVQKLLYYCQGWHLAFTGNPIFDDPIEAWDLGPVVPSVFRADKYNEGRPPSSELDDASLQTAHWVAGRYGSLSASELVALTHDEDPWKDADRVGPSAVMPQAAIADWFRRFVPQPARSQGPSAVLTGEDELPEIRRRLQQLSA